MEEIPQPLAIATDAIVLVIPPQLGGKPGEQFPFGKVAVATTPRGEAGKRRPVLLRRRAPLQDRYPPTAQSPTELEAEELKGFAVSPPVSAEAQQAGLVLRQTQAVLAKPLAQCRVVR